MPSLIETAKNSGMPNISTWVSEAEFGFELISKEIPHLPKNGKVLEVGCGSGLLLGMLAQSFNSIDFKGIEPIGKGFSALKDLNEWVKETGVDIERTPYENSVTKSKFDLIYCVNVFEHVKDWRHMIDWASMNLNEGGNFLVLCPNYGFPYESHFRKPIIFNKKITYKCFSRDIQRFESEFNAEGLWDSLNFVKKHLVKKYVKENYKELKFTMVDDTTIIDFMIARTLVDKEFRLRQKVVARVALFLKRVRCIGLLKKLPNTLPYMKILFKKQV